MLPVKPANSVQWLTLTRIRKQWHKICHRCFICSLTQLAQDCAGIILGSCGNEIQVMPSTKINVLGVPITMPYMTLQASL